MSACRICKHDETVHTRRLVSKRRGFSTRQACTECVCVENVQDQAERGET